MIKQYVAILQAVYSADDPVTAQVIAEAIRLNGSVDLELDEGDSVDVLEVMPLDISLSRAELIQHMRVTRNALIRTKVLQCFELAKELDKAAWILQHNAEDMWHMGSYDYGKFVEISQQVLKGETPDE